MLRRAAVMSLLIVVGLAACSGSDNPSASTSTASATATDGVSSSTVAETTTTSPTTTTTTTTLAPTTTIDEQTRLLAQVEPDLQAAYNALYLAQQNPTDPQRVAAALDARTGGQVAVTRDFLQSYVDDGVRILPVPPIEASITIEVAPSFVDGEENAVDVQVCQIDPWFLVETGGAPDGSDALIDDEVYAYRDSLRMEMLDGRWRIAAVSRIDAWMGVAECVA